MLSTVYASRYIKKMGSGRNLPCLIECEREDGSTVEVVVKYSCTLFEKEKNLAIEAIVAMLAADLGLPVAEPFVVQLSEDFIQTVNEAPIASNLSNSCRQAFGSALLTGGATAWLQGQTVAPGQSQLAAEIAVFDQIIINSDRLPRNPNLLFRDNTLLMIDHELSLGLNQVLFWREPWVDGGLSDLEGRERHIFARPYFETPVTSLERFDAAWQSLPPTRFKDYLTALPSSWVYDETKLQEILNYLMDVQRNIGSITKNALRVFA